LTKSYSIRRPLIKQLMALRKFEF